MGAPGQSSKGRTISLMAPYMRGLYHADFRLMGFPFNFVNSEQSTLIEPKTGVADMIVTWVAITPILGGFFVMAFPMVAGLPFLGATDLMGEVGMGPIDSFGSLLMIIPYYTEGLLVLILYRKLTARLSTFSTMFNENLVWLITPGKMRFGRMLATVFGITNFQMTYSRAHVGTTRGS